MFSFWFGAVRRAQRGNVAGFSKLSRVWEQLTIVQSEEDAKYVSQARDVRGNANGVSPGKRFMSGYS
jgi:hypothetical protein